jgi:hypothetical protein
VSTARSHVRPAAVDDLEPNTIAGMQRYAEPFGHFGELWCDDELVGAVCCGCAHVGNLP